MPDTDPLPADVLDALGRGNPIEAIKRLRTATGLGLKEAKDAIDAYASGAPVHLPPRPSDIALHADVSAALQSGNKIEAIRLLREHTGLGLKEAKDAVEAAETPASSSAPGFAPGEVPRSGNGAWWLLAIVVAVAVAYFLLKG